jgi:hypothetical protein
MTAIRAISITCIVLYCIVLCCIALLLVTMLKHLYIRLQPSLVSRASEDAESAAKAEFWTNEYALIELQGSLGCAHGHDTDSSVDGFDLGTLSFKSNVCLVKHDWLAQPIAVVCVMLTIAATGRSGVYHWQPSARRQGCSTRQAACHDAKATTTNLWQ